MRNTVYHVGDHVEFDYDGLVGSGVIRKIKEVGMRYIVELDEATAQDHGHSCEGFFPHNNGFYLDDEYITGIIPNEEVSIEIHDCDLFDILLH